MVYILPLDSVPSHCQGKLQDKYYYIDKHGSYLKYIMNEVIVPSSCKVLGGIKTPRTQTYSFLDYIPAKHVDAKTKHHFVSGWLKLSA